MESMRSLNRSLPRTSPQRRNQRQQNTQPPEDLISAFKAAAFSVTSLYKSATALQVPARAAGYQEALEDLLHFLDKENLGLCDGEGWSVRQWATERLDGNNTVHHESEDEEEDQVEDDKAEDTTNNQQMAVKDEEDLTSSVELPAKEEEITRPTISSLGADAAFTFRSPQLLPTSHMDGVISGHEPGIVHGTHKHETSPKHARARLARPNSHRAARNALGTGAGSKRLGDFFDLSGITFDSKDERASKRPKH